MPCVCITRVEKRGTEGAARYGPMEWPGNARNRSARKKGPLTRLPGDPHSSVVMLSRKSSNSHFFERISFLLLCNSSINFLMPYGSLPLPCIRTMLPSRGTWPFAGQESEPMGIRPSPMTRLHRALSATRPGNLKNTN